MDDIPDPTAEVPEDILAAARMMRVTYLALVLEGFSEDQAMAIVSTLLAAAIDGGKT